MPFYAFLSTRRREFTPLSGYLSVRDLYIRKRKKWNTKDFLPSQIMKPLLLDDLLSLSLFPPQREKKRRVAFGGAKGHFMHLVWVWMDKCGREMTNQTRPTPQARQSYSNCILIHPGSSQYSIHKYIHFTSYLLIAWLIFQQTAAVHDISKVLSLV